MASARPTAPEPLGLTFVVQDQALPITNVDAASTKLVTCVYPVLDLVQVYQPGGAAALELDGLVETITTTIDPEHLGPRSEAKDPSSRWGAMRHWSSVRPSRCRTRRNRCWRVCATPDASSNCRCGARRTPRRCSRGVYTLKDNEIPADDLVQIIVGTVEPPAWGNAPGAFIRATNGRLVVLQQRGVHAQIERFLRELGVSK